MLQSGIPRATAGAILGFFFGAAIVTLIRYFSSIEPFWNLGLASVLGVFMAAAGVVWGMGGFNPEMSAHPDDSAPEPNKDELAEQYGPLSILGDAGWTVGFSALIIMVVFIALAYVPGLGLNVTSIDEASVKSLGIVELNLFGQTIQANQGMLLVGFIAFTVISLVITAGILGLVLTWLNGQVESAKAVERTGSGLPRPLERAAANYAGRLADRIEPQDKETKAVVSKDE